jgi:hypothetical protein
MLGTYLLYESATVCVFVLPYTNVHLWSLYSRFILRLTHILSHVQLAWFSVLFDDRDMMLTAVCD